MVSVGSPRRFPLYIPFVPGACLTLRRFVYDLLRVPTCRCGGTTPVCTPPDKLCQLFTQYRGVIIPGRIMGVYDQLHLGAKRVGQAFAGSHIEHFLGQFSLSVSSTKFPLYPCKCYSFQFSLFFQSTSETASERGLLTVLPRVGDATQRPRFSRTPRSIP